MHDRPTAPELLEAVRHFLESDVVPALEGTKKFHARVAANVLAIVAREMESQERQLRQEWKSVKRLLEMTDAAEPRDLAELKQALRGATEQLCERIRSGAADHEPWRGEVLAHVRRTVADKLAVANPRFLAAEKEPR
jgi:hypothetical protein